MNKYINNQLRDFIVYNEGEYDPALSIRVTILDRLRCHGQRLRAALRLQAAMFWYDLRHGTDYRRIRNQLIREKRNQAFEARIGLVRS